MKTAVSIPEHVYRAADRAAQRLGLNRSQLDTQALVAFLSDRVGDEVTAALDDVYDAPRADLDGAPAGPALIDAGDWQW